MRRVQLTAAVTAVVVLAGCPGRASERAGAPDTGGQHAAGGGGTGADAGGPRDTIGVESTDGSPTERDSGVTGSTGGNAVETAPTGDSSLPRDTSNALASSAFGRVGPLVGLVTLAVTVLVAACEIRQDRGPQDPALEVAP